MSTPVIEVELERVAHGGTCVGRSGEKVIFVTGGLPGEVVRVAVTEVGKRFDRGRVVEVLRPGAGRVTAPCPIAGECGGCDWQHADIATQLELKTAVVAEQLRRLAGIEWTGSVRSVGEPLGWRTRMRYAVAGDSVGLRGRRSHDVVALPPTGCLVAAPGGPDSVALAQVGRGAKEVEVVVPADGDVTILADGQLRQGSWVVRERVGERLFAVDAAGFWQVHPRAASILTDAVVTALDPQPGEQALDLYCGVGLFAGALVDAGCEVLGVELSAHAIGNARRNVPEARFRAARLEQALGSLPSQCTLVVLDPPRRGAGAVVVSRLVGLGARAIAYVACDPAALARDLAYFEAGGYIPTWIQGYDLFPMTQHVECVVRLVPGDELSPSRVVGEASQ